MQRFVLRKLCPEQCPIQRLVQYKFMWIPITENRLSWEQQRSQLAGHTALKQSKGQMYDQCFRLSFRAMLSDIQAYAVTQCHV